MHINFLSVSLVVCFTRLYTLILEHSCAPRLKLCLIRFIRFCFVRIVEISRDGKLSIGLTRNNGNKIKTPIIKVSISIFNKLSKSLSHFIFSQYSNKQNEIDMMMIPKHNSTACPKPRPKFKLDNYIVLKVLILCHLERVFFVGSFTIMLHLMIHLPDQVLLKGRFTSIGCIQLRGIFHFYYCVRINFWYNCVFYD